MDIGGPRRGIGDACVDRGRRVEEVLRIRARRRLLRRIGLRLVGRSGLRRRRLLVGLVCVGGRKGVASEGRLREIQAVCIGPGRAQASHDELLVGDASRPAEAEAEKQKQTEVDSSREKAARPGRRQGVSSSAGRSRLFERSIATVKRRRRRLQRFGSWISTLLSFVLVLPIRPSFFQQTRNPGSGVSLMGLAEACKAWRCALGRRCGQNDQREKKKSASRQTGVRLGNLGGVERGGLF